MTPDSDDGRQVQNGTKRASAASLIDAFARQYEIDREAGRKSEKHRTFREYLTIGGLFVAAVVAYFQWRELRSTDHNIATQAEISGKQLAIMQRQLDAIERDQEPYYSISERLTVPFFQPVNAEIGYIAWNIPYANTGKGVARNTTVDTFMSINKAPFKRTPVRSEPVTMDETAPGNTGWFTIGSEPTYTQAQFETLKATDEAISVLAEFVYFDSLKKRYETTVCYTLNRNGSVARGLVTPARNAKQSEYEQARIS